MSAKLAIPSIDAVNALFDHPNSADAPFDGNRHLHHSAGNPRFTMGEALFEGTAVTLTLTGDGAVNLRSLGSSDTGTLLPPDSRNEVSCDRVQAMQRHLPDGIPHGTPIKYVAGD